MVVALKKAEEHFKKVFWDSVKKKLEELSINSNWNKNKIELSNIFESWANLNLKHKNGWLSINYEGQTLANHRIYYGISISKEKIEANQLDKLKIKDFLNTKLDYSSNKSTGWWIWLKYTDKNFGESSTIKLILPSNKDLLVEEFANRLWNMAKKIEPYINELVSVKMKKADNKSYTQ